MSSRLVGQARKAADSLNCRSTGRTYGRSAAAGLVRNVSGTCQGCESWCAEARSAQGGGQTVMLLRLDEGPCPVDGDVNEVSMSGRPDDDDRPPARMIPEQAPKDDQPVKPLPPMRGARRPVAAGVNQLDPATRHRFVPKKIFRAGRRPSRRTGFRASIRTVGRGDHLRPERPCRPLRARSPLRRSFSSTQERCHDVVSERWIGRAARTAGWHGDRASRTGRSHQGDRHVAPRTAKEPKNQARRTEVWVMT